MRLEKYVRKAFLVDATPVSEENMNDVAKWCGGVVREDGLGRFIKVEVNRPVNERQTKAYVGDWVLKAGKQFKVYEDKPFKATFEPQPVKSGNRVSTSA